MKEREIEKDSAYFDALRLKRTKTLIGVWDYLTSNDILKPTRFKLSIPLINEIVEHYTEDIAILKFRYRITEKIQLHKIAGLMTSLIVRYRPVMPLIDEYKSDREMYANELFAIIHGLSICGEYSQQEIKKLFDDEWFQLWFNDFFYLLHHRNHTPESLIFIYETLCFFKFPRNIASQSQQPE